jgi:predicted metal-dependent peptidase
MDPSKQKEHVAHVETFNVDDPLEDDIEKPSMAKQASDVGMKDGDKPAASGQAYC